MKKKILDFSVMKEEISQNNVLEMAELKLQRYINQKEMPPITEAKYELDLKRLLLEILTCKQVSSQYSGSIHIKRAVSLLENNHTKKITVVSVAKDLGLSVFYLQHLFKSETGISMKQKLNDIRITHAQQLITDTNYSIAKIAADVGYNSVQELNVNFKKKVGCTPTEFKKAISTPFHSHSFLNISRTSSLCFS